MHYFGDDPSTITSGMHVRIIKDDEYLSDIEIQRVRASKNVLILKFVGIDSIADAERICGCLAQIDKVDLSESDEDEYYWDDLIGMSVYDENDAQLGKVESIFSTKSNDVYVVSDGKREILLPAIKEVITKVDVENKVMRVHLLEGMRDDL